MATTPTSTESGIWQDRHRYAAESQYFEGIKVPEITQRQLRQRNVNVMYSLTLYQIKAILETREPQPRYKMQSIRYRTSEAKVYTIW